MSISVLSVLSPCPSTVDQSSLPSSSVKRGYLESCKAPFRPKKHPSRRTAPKYVRHSSREQVKPRQAGKKAVKSAGPGSCAGGDEEQSQNEVGEALAIERKNVITPLSIPRIDIVQASPSIGSKSPTFNNNVTNALERSPSMPAVLPEQTPKYQQQPFKPSLTRPLTSPSTEGGKTGSSALSGWVCKDTDTGARIPLLPLPGTPALELAGHDFGTSPSQGDQGAPLHTCGTETTQSVPTTFHFQGSNTSRSTSFPGRQQVDGKYTNPQEHDRAASSNGSKFSSRSTSLSSSVSRITNQMRVLRVTNPDPPSPGRPAALSRTPSMTIAQKRFVSCPPAPLQVERANEYKSTPHKVSSFDSPLSRATETPTSSSNSASTPSFRFSDGGRSPASAATPTSASSSLPATPTKLPSGATRPLALEYDHKNFYSSAQAAAEVEKAPRTTSPIAPPLVHTLEACKSPTVKTTTTAKEGKKPTRTKRHKVKRSKSSTSSRDADNSEGVESCFESIGAPSEWEPYVAPRKKRNGLNNSAAAKTKASKTKTKIKPRNDDAEVLTKVSPNIEPAPAPHLVEQKQEHQDAKLKMLPKPPKSPLVLTKPQVSAALDISTGQKLENLTTFWTPIGRVIIAPAPSTCISGLRMMPPTPTSLVDSAEHCKPKKTLAEAQACEKVVGTPTRAFLVPPRSPRPPNTRRLGRGHSERDALSRSELYPLHYKHDSLLALPSSDSVQNTALRLSLPLPSPMRLDAFTSDLLSRCGVGHDPDPLLVQLTAAPPPPRRRSVDEGIKEGAKALNDQMDNQHVQPQQKRLLPSPGDPFIASPPQLDTYKFPSLTPVQIRKEGDASCTSRPSLLHTHPATLRPSTPSSQGNTQTPTPGRYFPLAPPTPFRESITHDASPTPTPTLFRDTISGKRYTSSPLPVPPQLPPRHRRNALPDVSVLREQLVANGALVSGDEGVGQRRHEAKSKNAYRNYHNHRGLLNDDDANMKEPQGFKEHRSHRHRHQQFDNDDLIIPIIDLRKPYPDGIGMMEYERAKSLRDVHAQHRQHMDQINSTRSQDTPMPLTASHGRSANNRRSQQLSPCARFEQQLDSHTTHSQKGIQGYYCEEKARSGFEVLQRQSEENGYIRERGQERGRAREREKRNNCDGRGRREYECEHEQVQMQMQVERVVEQEEDQEALRLGEHKRGFDSCEIERWLEGLKRVELMMKQDEIGEEKSFFDTPRYRME